MICEISLRCRHAQTVNNGALSHKTNYFEILSGHQNRYIGSKVTAILLIGWILPTGFSMIFRCWFFGIDTTMCKGCKMQCFLYARHWLGPLGRFSIKSRIPSVFLSVTLRNTHFQMSWRPLGKECISNICLWWHSFQKKGCGSPGFFPSWRVLKCTLLWIVGKLAGEGLWLWLMADGCLHFNGTSKALQWHFHGNSTTLKQHTNIRNGIWWFYPHQFRDWVSPVCGINYKHLGQNYVPWKISQLLTLQSGGQTKL